MQTLNLLGKLSHILYFVRLYFAISDLYTCYKLNYRCLFMVIYTITIILIGLARLLIIDGMRTSKIYLIVVGSYFCEAFVYVFEKATGICGPKRLAFNIGSSAILFGLLVFLYPYFYQQSKTNVEQKSDEASQEIGGECEEESIKCENSHNLNFERPNEEKLKNKSVRI